MTRWRNVLGASSLMILLSGCGGLGGLTGSAPTVDATVGPTIVPTVARVAASAVPSPSPSPQAPRPTATTVVAAANRVFVGNTDGEGVFLRKTPAMADRLTAYADGTPLTLVGDDVDGDGQHWKHVRTPDGLEGYVPSTYTVSAQP
jgi:Bacterial SH3 domain